MTAGWQSRGRKDAIQDACIEVSHQMGVQTHFIGWPVDFLMATLKNGVVQNILVEIKSGQSAKLRRSQEEFLSLWRGPVYVVRSVEEMVELIRTLRGT